MLTWVSSTTKSLQLRTVLQSCRSIRKVKEHLSLTDIVFVGCNTGRPLDQERREAERRSHTNSQAAVAWLSQLNFASKQKDVFSQHQEGTGNWFLNTDAFKRWLNGNERILWCPGLREELLWESSRVLAPLLTVQKLGQVKPYLRTYNRYSVRPISYITRSTVIDHLHRTYSTNNIGIAFMYCDYKEQEQQTSVNLISSLLQQLVEQQSSVPDEVHSLWEEHTRRRTRPGLAECSRLLQSIASAFSKVFIVIDALDESSEITRDDLIAEIQKLASRLHLMATSRHNANIEQSFSDSIQLEIQAHDADVKAYIRTQIDKRERLKKFVRADPSLQEMIETKLASKAQGMSVLYTRSSITYSD